MPGPKKQYERKVDLRIDEDLLSKLDEWRTDEWWDRYKKSEIEFDAGRKSRGEAIRLAIKRMVDG